MVMLLQHLRSQRPEHRQGVLKQSGGRLGETLRKLLRVERVGLVEQPFALRGEPHDEGSAVLRRHLLRDETVSQQAPHQPRHIPAGDLQVRGYRSEIDAIRIAIDLREKLELRHRQPEFRTESAVQRREYRAFEGQNLKPDAGLGLSSVVLPSGRSRICSHRKPHSSSNPFRPKRSAGTVARSLPFGSPLAYFMILHKQSRHCAGRVGSVLAYASAGPS